MVLVFGNTQSTLRIMKCLVNTFNTHTLYKRQTGKEAIDSCHTNEMDILKRFFKRIVFVFKLCLGEADGLPFRGDDLGLHTAVTTLDLEVIAEFDPFLKNHIEKRSNKVK